MAKKSKKRKYSKGASKEGLKNEMRRYNGAPPRAATAERAAR